MSTNNCPLESAEQAALFQWAAYNSGRYPELKLMFHIPNGGTRNKIEAVHLKQQGVKSGVPDVFLPAPCGEWHGLFIEMKRQHGGTVSREQRMWIGKLAEQGYKAVVCRGCNEAIAEIEKYLERR